MILKNMGGENRSKNDKFDSLNEAVGKVPKAAK
jgi:hypothetical protein